MLSGHGGLAHEVADALWLVTVGGLAERVGYPMDRVVESHPRPVYGVSKLKAAVPRISVTILATLLIGTAPVSAAVRDCPLRDAPFSVDSPLLDVLLSSAATAAANQALGGMLERPPPMIASTQPPTFAAILTVRAAAGFAKSRSIDLVALDRTLRALPVSDADRTARCARYDDDRPSFALAAGKPHLLLFEKINGFKDVPSFNAAHAALLAMAKRKGWNLVVTDKGGAFTPGTLAKFDAVIWNNISGDVLTMSQRRAFRSYIERGGAYIGVHGSAGDPVYFWDWYADTLLGARFAGHPMNPQFQAARIVVDNKANPAARRLPAEWVMKDEWYSFKSSPRLKGADIIATLDESSYKQNGFAGERLTMGDHPIAWTKHIGRGRMFYSAIGHLPETYSDPRYVVMLEDGIGWAIKGKQQSAKR